MKRIIILFSQLLRLKILIITSSVIRHSRYLPSNSKNNLKSNLKRSTNNNKNNSKSSSEIKRRNSRNNLDCSSKCSVSNKTSKFRLYINKWTLRLLRKKAFLSQKNQYAAPYSEEAKTSRERLKKKSTK